MTNVVTLDPALRSIEECLSYLREQKERFGLKNLIFVAVDHEGRLVHGSSSQTHSDLLYSVTWLKERIMQRLRNTGAMPA